MQVNEILMLIINLGIIIAIISNNTKLKIIPFYKLLLSSYFIIFFGWISTVVEGIIYPDFFNACEHASYLVFSIMMLVWIGKIIPRRAKK